MPEIWRKSRGPGARFSVVANKAGHFFVNFDSLSRLRKSGLFATTRAFIFYITWELNGGPEKLYRDDLRAEFNRPTGENPGLVAVTTHMLRLQLTQE